MRTTSPASRWRWWLSCAVLCSVCVSVAWLLVPVAAFRQPAEGTSMSDADDLQPERQIVDAAIAPLPRWDAAWFQPVVAYAVGRQPRVPMTTYTPVRAASRAPPVCPA